MIPLYEMSRIGAYIEAESLLVVASAKEECRDGGRWGGRTVVKGSCISLENNETILKLTVVMVAQLCDYTKHHRVVHFKWMNHMLCESYFNKAVTKSN